MSRLLRTGVILSALFVFAGGVLFLLRHPTPVTDYRHFHRRIAFSVVAFSYQRDWMYVLVTLIVLGLLFFSLFGAHA